MRFNIRQTAQNFLAECIERQWLIKKRLRSVVSPAMLAEPIPTGRHAR